MLAEKRIKRRNWSHALKLYLCDCVRRVNLNIFIALMTHVTLIHFPHCLLLQVKIKSFIPSKVHLSCGYAGVAFGHLVFKNYIFIYLYLRIAHS